MKSVLLLVLLTIIAGAGFAGPAIVGTERFTDSKLELTVLKGTVLLPPDGLWRAIEPAPETGLRQVFLTPSEDALRRMQGERGFKAEQMRAVEASQQFLNMVYWQCWRYAQTNQFRGPTAFADLEGLTNRLNPLSRFENFDLSDFYLAPGIIITNRNAFANAQTNAEILVIEVKPGLDDGKHWILFNDGRTERRPIDPGLAAKFNLAISPKNPTNGVTWTVPTGAVEYQGLALLADANRAPFSLQVENRETGEKDVCTWDIASAKTGTADLMQAWAARRAAIWAALFTQTDSSVLQYWAGRQKALYGMEPPPPARRARPGRGESTDAFSVLSGRAAIRETLQMQALADADEIRWDTQDITVNSIAGVDVKSHPFAEMLKNTAPGGALPPLADFFPPDRAFFHFSKPQTLTAFLGGGAEFAFNAGALAVQNSIAYNLKDKYLARLGISEEWMQGILSSGAVAELAIGLPDLFVIDGTEITVLARVPAIGLLAPALQALNLDGLSGRIVERAAAGGRTAYWTLEGNLLAIGTSRPELEMILALRKSGGVGSLGQSAEFRYMLSQLPIRPDTTFYGYLSDPFIRRLVGPRVKIAQLRRLRARANLEGLTAAALLYRLDGQPGPITIEALVAKGYADPRMSQKDYSLDEDLVARSKEYGTPAELKSCDELTVEKVTHEEAHAYSNYVANYSRLWRQYFDPIAFRLDETASGRLELTTFILPLIDNSIYNGVKGAVRSADDPAKFRIPSLSPKPVLLLSLNLSDESWVTVTKSILTDFANRYTRINPEVFDLLGPGAHLAIQDADPVLTFGGGDVLGAFGSPMLGGMRGEMLYVPMLLSVLTRPCQLMVEVKDPQRAIRMLNAATALAPVSRDFDWGPKATFYRIEGRDAWTCMVDMFGLIKIRFGIEVQDGFIVLSNIPWGQQTEIRDVEEAALNGVSLRVDPEAGALQLPGLFTSATERERAAALQGIGYLQPIATAGGLSVPEAEAFSARCFGFVPRHPGQGAWTESAGEVRSAVYGGLHDPTQPAYTPGARNFGAFSGVSNLTLNVQFEDSGLRVSAGWSVAK